MEVRLPLCPLGSGGTLDGQPIPSSLCRLSVSCVLLIQCDGPRHPPVSVSHDPRRPDPHPGTLVLVSLSGGTPSSVTSTRPCLPCLNLSCRLRELTLDPSRLPDRRRVLPEVGPGPVPVRVETTRSSTHPSPKRPRRPGRTEVSVYKFGGAGDFPKPRLCRSKLRVETVNALTLGAGKVLRSEGAGIVPFSGRWEGRHTPSLPRHDLSNVGPRVRVFRKILSPDLINRRP